jgi:hypothetical protein
LSFFWLEFIWGLESIIFIFCLLGICVIGWGYDVLPMRCLCYCGVGFSFAIQEAQHFYHKVLENLGLW